MSADAHIEIQRLKRLHERAEMELAMLQRRAHWTPEEEREMLALKRLKLRLKDRMSWVESIVREHVALQ
jgi:DNA-binding transcriptional regulator GbsR (MarR family)